MTPTPAAKAKLLPEDRETKNFHAINREMDRRRTHEESVKGKETPFRCVFKTRHGWAYTYHETYEDAELSEHTACGYSIGGSWLQRAKKTRIEKEGPRGGWKKYKPENAA